MSSRKECEGFVCKRRAIGRNEHTEMYDLLCSTIGRLIGCAWGRGGERMGGYVEHVCTSAKHKTVVRISTCPLSLSVRSESLRGLGV